MIELRDYQAAAVAAVERAYAQGRRRVVVTLPCGAGRLWHVLVGECWSGLHTAWASRTPGTPPCYACTCCVAPALS